MRKVLLSLLVSVALLGAVFGLIQEARSQAPVGPDGRVVVASEVQGDNRREITAPAGAAPESPNIGFIDSPTVTCYQPDSTQDACFINWYYMSVSADPASIVAMTATIYSIGPVMRIQGFFQTSMYVPFNMQDRGIRVPCGPLGAGGNETLGNAYPWAIKAVDSNKLVSTNSGMLFCPAYQP